MLAALIAMALPPTTNPLVDLRKLIPDAVLDVRYATADNIAGKPLYPFPAAYLRRSSAEKLVKAADALRARGLRLVVHDAYRPLSVQKALWAIKPDSNYVANPAKGSSHNRGGAVDVALADANGKPLPSPSAYDEFGPRARVRVKALDEAMSAAGFEPLASEWWHYRDADAKDWPVLDVPFEELEK
ncbi:MAG: M15 family metallopeptidase [Elusimicrobiota bacterium]|nr:MAG: M15 family metallopeptidase [Elusimicrobiota bacterium]